MQSTEKKRLVPCPECGKLAEFSPNNAFRPFCSERCKMIDLGIWASEGYRIETPITPDALDAEDLN
jgi:hypothetical protein